MKKYLLYELKKNAFSICCVTVIISIIYIAPMLFQPYFFPNLGVISFFGGCLAILIPMQNFTYRMKKRSVDLYYSLPLSHTKILFVRFIFGIIELYFIYTVAYWLGALTVIAHFAEEIQAIYYVPQYFASILPLYFLYAISSFTFTRANAAGDGLAFTVLWFCVAPLVLFVLFIAFSLSTDLVIPLFFFPTAPLDTVTTYFQYKLLGETGAVYNAEYLGFAYTVLLAAGSTAGLFLLEGKTKAENAGQISDSLFGYKVMIPLYTVCLVWLSAWAGSFSLIPLYRDGIHRYSDVYSHRSI